jgi:hypothetical protein
MPVNFILGKDAKTYYGSTPIDGDSNTVDALIAGMTEAGNIRDLTLSLEKGESDITVRSDDSWTILAATLKTATVEFQMKWLPGDSFFEAVKDSFLNDTELPLVVLDQDRDAMDAEGFAANFNVFSFSRNEALTEAILVDVSMKPSSFPQWAYSSGFPSS